jgi:hypothetical protein
MINIIQSRFKFHSIDFFILIKDSIHFIIVINFIVTINNFIDFINFKDFFIDFILNLILFI